MANDLAKKFLVTFDSEKDAAFMYELAGHDPFEIQQAVYDFQTITVPAVMAKPWGQLITARLERRLKWLEIKRDDVMRSYSSVTPFKKRKALYEQKIPVLDEMIKRTKEQLRMEPVLTWLPSDVASLKIHGVNTYLQYYVDRFFPSVPLVQQKPC